MMTGAVKMSEMIQTAISARRQLRRVQKERDFIGYTITMYLPSLRNIFPDQLLPWRRQVVI
jgi:hypothetical protein